MSLPNKPEIWASSPSRARTPPDSPAIPGRRLRQVDRPHITFTKAASRSHSKRRARQVGNRPQSAPGNRGEGPWAPRLLEAAEPAEDSAPLRQAPPARPRLRDAERLRGREPRSPGCAPHPAPRPAAATGTAPPASPGSPEQSRATQGASMLQPSLPFLNIKKTKARQILWSSFLTPPPPLSFLFSFLCTVFFFLFCLGASLAKYLKRHTLLPADRLSQVASYH